MSEILSTVVIPALQQLELKPLLDLEHGTLVVPIGTPDNGRYLINLHGWDERDEVFMNVIICGVPERRHIAVALLLADLNARFMYATFSLGPRGAQIDTCVDLAYADDATAAARRALERLQFAVNESAACIEWTARDPDHPHVLCEAEEIVGQAFEVEEGDA